MKNSEEFVDYYNRIDAFLKKETRLDSLASFSLKLKESKNKAVTRFYDELISLGELRNAIVHNPKIDGNPIAEPHTKTVERIKNIYHQISKPKKVTPEFQFEVFGAYENDFINGILLKMRKSSFSQFPVFDKNDKVIELINTNTISRWLSNNLEENRTIIIDCVKIKDLLSEIEFENNYRFISKNASIFDAYDLFISQINKEMRNLDVLFITDSGKEHEKLLGLITIEDIANLIDDSYPSQKI